ncbi:MAG: type II toxin-antitoxin system VapC family toxin [Deltaproteobacteria bacterium]|nr:type II toxin-antitoxin system VapC family toxin [Deltaproteobacteria bacterium]
MILYLDTSALVKLYVDEEGSERIRGLVESAQVIATSRVSYVEARAGVARKLREGDLTEREYRQILEDLEKDWKSYFIVEVSERVTRIGGELVGRHPIRGFDAIHLASGILLKNRTEEEVLFACFDERLKEAAKSEALLV